MTKPVRGLLLGITAAAAFGMNASAAGAEIVRTSAGVLASGYVQTAQNNPPGSFFWTNQVTHVPTGTLVCAGVGAFGPGYCQGWVAGYTKTGNGYEVTKP